MKPVFSIVIPVYNSAGCLIELNAQIEEALINFSYELILVNDGSVDKSWERIVEICNKNNKATGISLRKDSGQDNAIMAGFKLIKGEFVVIMDDDLQHSPQDIIKLYTQCNKCHDVCYALFQQKAQKLWKNLGSWLNGKPSEKILSKPAEIYLSPFKIFKEEVAKELIKYTGPYPYIDALLLSVTNNITQIPIEHYNRYSGNSNFNLIKSISVFLRHATGYSIYPLRLAIYLGFLSALLSFFAGIYFLVDYFREGEKVEGWISTILLILFLGGVILICLGITGEYIGRMFLTINNKPQYTIEKIIQPPYSNDKSEKV